MGTYINYHVDALADRPCVVLDRALSTHDAIHMKCTTEEEARVYVAAFSKNPDLGDVRLQRVTTTIETEDLLTEIDNG